jgi:hypothetical protein
VINMDGKCTKAFGVSLTRVDGSDISKKLDPIDIPKARCSSVH